ncbi:hypothetical protein PM082_007284 [Marasmius tenuissimus]|nr:hypothetical protein PM082_007284 [Marasmius tenuissimus]
MFTSFTTNSSGSWMSPYTSPRTENSASSSSAWSVRERELSPISPIWSTGDFSPVPHVNTPLRSPSLAHPHRPSISCIPLPSQVEHRKPISLHYSLRHASESTGFDPVDLSSAQRFVQNGLEASYVTGRPSHLSFPATTPPLPSLSIVHPSLPWSITVHRTHAEYVTVADVLFTLGENLQMPLDREWTEKVTRRQRLDRRQRLIRLDLLCGKTAFAGLSRSQMGGDTWRLHVR